MKKNLPILFEFMYVISNIKKLEISKKFLEAFSEYVNYKETPNYFSGLAVLQCKY